jgi:putative flavoprotein involved in K+ transport
MKDLSKHYVDTIVIGGGQAGLSVGYHLKQQGRPFLILDASRKIGEAWRRRWDSLRLFTPARYAGLPGMPFPARGDAFPTKEDMANYLENYASHFDLPVRTGVRVDGVWKERGRFVVSAGNERFEADNVVVAMANYQVPRVPEFAAELTPAIKQLHSHNYRNPSQLPKGDVLIVGAGNSGADIAMEVVRTHHTFMSGKESGYIPFPIDSFLSRHVLVRFVRFAFHHVLTVKTPIGRRARPKILTQAAPLVRVKPKTLLAAGVERVARVVGVRDGKPMLSDGRVLDVKSVVWCTGYEPGFSWINLPIFDESGRPKHDSGIVREIPGMYFVGLHYLYALSSATLMGVGRDAERIVKRIAGTRTEAVVRAVAA